MRRSSTLNQLLSKHDQETQRILRRSIDIVTKARIALMENPDYDYVAATTLWVIRYRMMCEARALAEAGWSRPGTDGWYTRLCRIQRGEPAND